MNAPDVAYQVARQFAALRRRYLWVRLSTSLCLAFGFLLAFWSVLALIDYRWEWPMQWRITALSVAAVLTTAVVLWRTVAIFRQSRPRSFAGVLERSFEDFGQRIRTVLDTVDGRVSGPQAMLAALGNQTLGRWESVSPARVLPVAMLWSAAAVLLVLACVTLGLFGSGTEMRLALLRAIGSDQPYTTLEVTPGDVRLLEGTSIDVSVDLIGRTERDVLLRYRELRPAPSATTDPSDTDAAEPVESTADAENWIESELVADQDAVSEDGRRKTFRAALGKAAWPIEYQFVSSGQFASGAQSTAIHRIDIQPLIEVDRISINVQPPEYTGLQTREFSKPELTVLEKSLVTVTIELNHPLEEAVLEIGPKKSTLQATELETPSDRTRWSFSLPADNTLRWRFAGSGVDGTPMDPVMGRLGIRRDTAPSIRWREPSDEIKVHTLAEVPLGVQIADDHGIVEAGIAFQLGGDDEYVLTDWMAQSEQTGTEETATKTRLLLAELLPLESLQLSERDFIAYYAYAIDNRPWGNHRSESDVRYIDIRPLRQFYQEIDPPDGNGGGGSRVLVQLDEIIRRERFVINRTRSLVRGKADLASQLGTIDRLVENQSELADLTRFLAEFFISRGNDDVEALSQAEATMLQASDSLAAGSLDLAMAQEQEALRYLAEARRTLEIALLTRMTAAQQQALRRLARQLRQKLRRDRPETDRELADSLMQIAASQRRLAAMAQSNASTQANASSQSGSGGQPNSMSTEGSGETGDEATDTPSEAQPGSTPEDDNDPPSDAEQDSEDASDDGEATESGENEPDSDQPESDDPESDEPSAAEKLYEQQVDLLERLEAVRDQLNDRLAQSDLMSRRLDEAQTQMDELATLARAEDFEKLADGGRMASDLIEETGLQLEALSAMEPVTRVSSLRDLTGGIASMEHRLAKSNEPREERNGSGERSTDPTEMLKRLSARLTARAETLEDVLGSQADIGDIEMSEVNDQLRKFADETEFLDQLSSTKTAAEELEQSASVPDQEEASEAFERAVDYAEAARQLERLYQQLVTPRLARLRRMEQQASRLANRMGGGGGGPKDPENQRELRQLKNDLQQESLQELAEVLEGGGQGDEAEDRDSQQGSESMVSDQNAGGGAMPPRDTVAGRVQLVADELRKRIQQVILLEIAVDRDTPVPTEYRRAVDGYFKALASEPSGDRSMQDGGSL